MQLAVAGERAIRDKMEAHIQAIQTRGYGTHYGEGSQYTPVAGASQVKSSCISWAMECTGAAFRAAGQGALWDTIASRTRAAHLRGMVLADALVRIAGWKGVYWNPDTANPCDGEPEHPFSYVVARSNSTYYNVRIEDLVIDFRPTTLPMLHAPVTRPREADLRGIQALAHVPFWVGCARGGAHVFCGTRVMVSEFHVANDATDRNAIELVPLQRYDWLSGIICVPPGVWPGVSPRG